MSSTSNSQNLLTNVFRPAYVYDPSLGYVPKLIVSNVDNFVGANGSFSNLSIGDELSNVYIGKDAGNPNSAAELYGSSKVTAIGFESGKGNADCLNDVFLGNTSGSNGSNISNSVYLGGGAGGANRDCTNNVYIGYNSGVGSVSSSNEVAIGANTIAGGVSNVYIGTSTGSEGSGNIFIGPNIAPGVKTDELRIGVGNKVAIFGDLSGQRIGINTTTFQPGTSFDVSGAAFFNNQVGIQIIPTHSLDVAGQIFATDGVLVNTTGPARPGVALVDEPTSGIYGDICGGEVSFGFSIAGQPVATMTDTCFNILTNLAVSGTFGAATQFGTNQIVQGWLRMPDSNGALLDMSEGNLKVQNTIVAGGSNIRIGNGFITDTCTNGYIRMLDDFSIIKIDMSGGNISNSGITRSRDISTNSIVTLDGSTNQIGGVFLLSGAVRNALVPTTFDISGGNISNSGITRSRDISTNAITTLDASVNRVGGVVLVEGALRNALVPTTFDISGGNISNSGTTQSTNAIVSGYIRNALIPTTFDISGGNIFSSLSVRTSNVVISGRFSNTDSTKTNVIGGVTLVNGNISNDGTTSNSIAGITLSSGNITTLEGSNKVGGVTLSNSNISNSSSTSNSIGGVTLSNNNISNSSSSSNSIGGVTLNSGNVIAGSGTAAAPSFTFAGDTGNGVFRPGSNQVAISTADTQRMVVSNANVGIGITSPITKLSISGDEATSGILLTNNSANDAVRAITAALVSNEICGLSSISANTAGSDAGQLRLSAGGGTNVIHKSYIDMYGYSTNDIRIGTAGVERMRINSSGVGIGTTSPQYILDISSPALSAGIRVTAPNAQFNLQDPGNSFPLQMYSSTTGQGIVTGASRINISTNNLTGNVGLNVVGNLLGIGTSTPAYTLDVSGTIRATGGVLGGGSIPIGGIIMWSGSIANIPTGWALCDGTNSTPNLCDRFIIGAGSSFAVGASGGSTTIAISNLPNHGHTITDVSHNHQYTFLQGTASPTGSGGVTCRDIPFTNTTANSFTGITKTTTTITTDNAGTPAGSTGQAYYQPYYALAYIMRTS